MLGGFGHVSDADIDGSRRFLMKVWRSAVVGDNRSMQPFKWSWCRLNEV